MYQVKKKASASKSFSNGIVEQWNDKKGYGFICSASSNKNIFFHIKNVKTTKKRPAKGQKVRFTISNDDKGRLKAINVRMIESRSTKGLLSSLQKHPAIIWGLVLASFFLLFFFQLFPHALLLGIVCISVLTFSVYALDKVAAQKGQRRVPEKTLHLLSLLGGWPGALFAQKQLRHKTQKKAFQLLFWATVVINCGILILFENMIQFDFEDINLCLIMACG